MKSTGETTTIERPFKEWERTRPACCIRRRAECSFSQTMFFGAEAEKRRPEARAPHCSLEISRSGLGGDGRPWRIGTEIYGDRDVISRKLSVPNAERIFFIRPALRAGFTIEEIFNFTKIEPVAADVSPLQSFPGEI